MNQRTLDLKLILNACMKNNYRLFAFFGQISAVMLLLFSCQPDNLRAELDGLNNRLVALEEGLEQLNRSIDNTRILFSGVSIVGVTPKESGYVVELSNGQTLTLANAKEVHTLMPELSIDGQGYWIYRTTQSGTFQQLLDKNEQPLSALPTSTTGEPVVSPKLRVDGQGYWQVSTDGGTTYRGLTDPLGAPIKALAEQPGKTSMFQSVSYNSNTKKLELVLTADNQTFSFPVIDSFFLKVKGATETQLFPLGEKRLYEVEQSEVAKVVIQAPDGWLVRLDEQELSITAPTQNNIEKEESIRLIITSDKGYIRIVPIQVRLLTTSFDANACKAWLDFKNQTAQNLLLDFSYAGYKHGEVAPPEVWSLGYTVYDVTRYGAVPNDGRSDREAFKRIISTILGGAKNKPDAQAVIYFPEGEFILHDETDNVANGTASESIQLLMGGVILKGAGRDKTFIKMETPNLPTDPKVMYSSPVMIEFKHNSTVSELTSVTQDAPQGSFSVNVASTKGVNVGDWVCLQLVNNDPQLIKQELAPYSATATMTNLNEVGVQVWDYHQVKAIKGSLVTFVEPIMHGVEAKWGWKFCKYPHYENVGVEDLTFVGRAKGDFVHHASWEDDGAYKPINFVRLTNSWMRRVDFQSVSEASSIVSCANFSAMDITISGNRGHAAIRSQASSRVFIGKVTDQSDGHLIDHPSVFMKGAGQYHACGVSKQSLGAVLWKIDWGKDACFESHATQPRATLFDHCRGGFMRFRQGGDYNQMPNHLADLTLWNFEAKNAAKESPFIWWDNGSLWWKLLPPTIVGFHGGSVTFDQSQVKLDANHGSVVSPYSLYEAQLRLRLGFVPAWLNTLNTY